MKFLSVVFTLLIFTSLNLNADEWKLKNISLQTENDADIRDDGAYTYGSALGALFYRNDINNSALHIPFTSYKNSDNYISFNIAHQMYTPQDFENPNLIKNDRPYAGYLYLQTALHQSKNNTLKSLTLQIGMVGPVAGMKEVQELIHSLIGSPTPQGWDNQLKNEFIFQINYAQKKYYDLDNIFKYGYNASIIPEFGVELGNASTKAYTSALFRWGKNIPKDYGAYVIDNTNYSKIPLKNKINGNKKWRFYLNVGLKANLLAHNIFLDGNIFQESHSVEKNIFLVDVTYGLSAAYKHFSLDYIRRHSTKEFKSQENYYSYGSLLFSYNY